MRQRSTSLGRTGLLALPLLASGCATYSACTAPACADDARLERDVVAALDQDKAFLPGSVYARTKDKVVYLYGVADTDYERRRAEGLAGAVAGVVRVVDFIGMRNR